MKNPPSFLREIFSRGGYVDERGNLRTARLIVHTLFLMGILLVGYGLFFRLYRLMGWDKNSSLNTFIEEFGTIGVATYVYVVDFLILPLTVDLVWPFVASWSLIKVTIVLGTASVAGALSSYLVGRLVGLLPMFKAWVQTVIEGESHSLVRRYGVWAIVISGLSPLPFSTICLASGVLKLPVKRVAAASSIRYVRMGIYWLIMTGIIM